MHRTITILFAILVLALGAAPAVYAAGHNQLEVVVYRDNPGQHGPTQELVKQWAEENNTTVKITMAGHSTRRTIITTALEGASGPDILIMANFEGFLYGDGLMDISDLAEEIGKANGGWYDISVSMGKIDGVWKALPIYNYPHMMLYRRDMFEAAGVSVPDTWADFRKTLQGLKDSKAVKATPFGISIGRSFDGQQFLVALILSHGGKVLSDDGSKVVFNSPETVAALKYVIDLYKDGLIDPTTPGWNDGTNNQALLSGRMAITFNSNSIKLQAKREFQDLYPDIGTAIYPKGPVKRASNPNVFSYGIRKTTKQPDKAKQLLAFLFRKDNYAKVLTATEGAVGVSLQGFENLDVWKDPDNATNLKAQPSSYMYTIPSAKSAEIFNNYVIIDMVADVLVNGKTPEEAVAKAASTMEKILLAK